METETQSNIFNLSFLIKMSIDMAKSKIIIAVPVIAERREICFSKPNKNNTTDIIKRTNKTELKIMLRNFVFFII